MEGGPKENFPVPERITTIEELIRAILVPGMTEVMRLHLMREWTIAQEEAVKTSRDAIVLNINRAKLYELVGDAESALDCLWEAKYQADQEGEVELQDQIFRKIQEI